MLPARFSFLGVKLLPVQAKKVLTARNSQGLNLLANGNGSSVDRLRYRGLPSAVSQRIGKGITALRAELYLLKVRSGFQYASNAHHRKGQDS